jgi:hypothetical protein
MSANIGPATNRETIARLVAISRRNREDARKLEAMEHFEKRRGKLFMGRRGSLGLVDRFILLTICHIVHDCAGTRPPVIISCYKVEFPPGATSPLSLN